jgi:hypothetical protein
MFRGDIRICGEGKGAIGLELFHVILAMACYDSLNSGDPSLHKS